MTTQIPTPTKMPRHIAEDAATAAIRAVQKEMGIVCGDFAGAHFSDEEGSGWSAMVDALTRYALAEFRFGDSQ